MAGHPIFFDPVNHVYHNLLNERLVSNTEILEGMGFSDYSQVPEQYRIPALERGTDVHKATALLDNKRHWAKAGYGHVRGYVEAWRRFKKDFKFTPIIIETPLHDPVYKIATTPDRWGRRSIHGEITVQIKTGKIEDWVGLQLAFEERCILLDLGRVVPVQMVSTDRRFAVELRSDGTYKERRFDDPNDIRVFLSAVTVHQWQRKHGGRQR